jgi:hypothetical protein
LQDKDFHTAPVFLPKKTKPAIAYGKSFIANDDESLIIF